MRLEPYFFWQQNYQFLLTVVTKKFSEIRNLYIQILPIGSTKKTKFNFGWPNF